jgi:hypothetical protein
MNGDQSVVAVQEHERRALANPMDMNHEQFKQALELRKANRDMLIEWVRASLVEGVDYGRLHIVKKSSCRLANEGRAAECQDPSHWSKPSMFKPGAEKVCAMLGVTPRYPSLPEYEQAALQGRKLEHIILRCELVNSAGMKVAEGVGARDTSKDYYDLNKSLKMCEKSGHIDATLRMAGMSELFTQDDPDPEQDEEEKLSEKHVLELFNMVNDSGLYDSEEKAHRQMANLARAMGKDRLLDVPLSMFEVCRAQMQKGLDAVRAKKSKPKEDM